MREHNYYKKLTYENKWDRHYCCYWKRGARSIKRMNRRLLRRKLKSGMYD